MGGMVTGEYITQCVGRLNRVQTYLHLHEHGAEKLGSARTFERQMPRRPTGSARTPTTEEAKHLAARKLVDLEREVDLVTERRIPS